MSKAKQNNFVKQAGEAAQKFAEAASEGSKKAAKVVSKKR